MCVGFEPTQTTFRAFRLPTRQFLDLMLDISRYCFGVSIKNEFVSLCHITSSTGFEPASTG